MENVSAAELLGYPVPLCIAVGEGERGGQHVRPAVGGCGGGTAHAAIARGAASLHPPC